MPARPSRLGRLVALLLVLFGVPQLAAQGQKPKHDGGGLDGGINAACPPEGCITGVVVTPDGTPAPGHPPNSGPWSLDFFVRNIGNIPGTFTLTCTAKLGPVCKSVTPSTLVALGPDAGAEVTVTYSLTATTGATATVSLTATNGGTATDAGSYKVSATDPVSVIVTPDGAVAPSRIRNTGPYTEQFTVRNPANTGTSTYTITCAGTGSVTCTGPTTTVVTLAPNTQTDIGANYTAGAAGTGTLSLKATSGAVSDTGYYSVTVAAPSPQAPQVAVGSVNPGTTVERSLCLTVRLSEDAASECSDLRVVHRLPAIRTLNKVRAPTLLYNSSMAHPAPWVAANVTLPATSTVPDSVTGKLTIGGTVSATGKWTGSQWAPGQTRRTVLLFDALTKATGVYAYTLEIRTWFPSTSKPTTVTGSLAIVNRSASAFGSGWWLAGLEALDVATKVWVGGDGSVRQYLPVAGQTNVWAAAAVDHPDTLKLIANQYIRFDQDSVRVTFDNTGKHVATTNRQKHVTRFTYASGLLDSIVLPPSGSGKAYKFTYTSGRLSSVKAPGLTSAGRTVTVTNVGGDLKTIQDPDGSTVQFNYWTTAGSEHIMVARGDRLGVFTSFDWAGKKVFQSRVLSGGIIIGIYAVENLGAGNSVDTALAYTKVDGPRPVSLGDSTLFWVDSLGAVRKILDAKANATTLTRGDARWPGLVTRVQRANGQVLGATYDDRGRLLSATDSSTKRGTTYATMRYQWDTKWDEVTQVTQPEGDNVTMFYEATTGNRLWQQDGRGSTSRTNFTYNGANQVATVTQPTTPVQRIFYNGLGNLDSIATPKGYVTRYRTDALGRDTLVDSPIDTVATSTRRQIQRIMYDAADRDTLTVSAGPAIGTTPVETLFVRKRYNLAGRMDSLSRWARPNSAGAGTMTTRWVYDGIGRPVKEIAPDLQVDSTEYDAAGNVVTHIPRRGVSLAVRMTYDAMNRLTRRQFPSVPYGVLPSAIDGSLSGKPTNFAAYTVPADDQNFDYDAVGNLIKADNINARVHRTFNKNGSVATDSLYINTSSGSDFTVHKYETKYQYDLNGRRTVLDFPNQFSGSALTYAYDPAFGGLTTVTDPQSSSYALTYTLRNELRSITYPGQYRQELTYDPDGRLAADSIFNGTTTGLRWPYANPRAAVNTYDARGRVLVSNDPVAFKDHLTATYSGLGYVVGTSFQQQGKYNGNPGAIYQVNETFRNDGLGNKYYSDSRVTLNSQSLDSSAFTNRTATFKADSGRLNTETPNAGVISYSYDVDGNVVYVIQAGSPADERRSYYAADGKLTRVVSRNSGSTRPTPLTYYRENVDVYRYDALGRRVWLKADKDCQDSSLPSDAALLCRVSLLRRTIWDGDQELAEIQMPGDSTTTEQQYWENDTQDVLLPTLTVNGSPADKNPFFGRVVYTQGPSLDRPLAVYRMGYVVAEDTLGFALTPTSFGLFTINPFWSRDGEATLGAFETGNRINCHTIAGRPACVTLRWPFAFSAYDRDRGFSRFAWHGSLLEGRRDASGLLYKRNRFYDPASGRFTQEDPIGLAGGLNLYAFGAGDPVSFSDPFGLKECHQQGNCTQSDVYVPNSAAVGDPARFFGSPRNAAGSATAGVALPAVTQPLGRLAKPIADRTSLSLEVTAGPVTAAFGTDATSVALQGEVALKLMVALTVAEPDPSTFSGAIGGDVGEGLLVGGSLLLGKNGVIGPLQGGSLRAGVGLTLPLGTSQLLERIGMLSLNLNGH